ncbi:MAG TPA: hypothetical protein VFS66_00065 [Acidimicrobiia bacterium]|nr:hypothetical protein [Acidimicrobiia bacterium]
MIFDPPAKSRRRVVGRFLWPILITVALVLAVVVTTAGQETRSQLQYLDQIREQAIDLSRSGASIQEVIPRLREIGRDEFTTVFDAVEEDLDVAMAFVAEEPPIDTLIPVWALYRQAVEAWSRGVTGLDEAILFAADNPSDDVISNLVGDALADLRAGDALYRNLQAEFGREEIPDPVSIPFDVIMSPAEGGIANLSQTYVAAARAATNQLGLRPSLKVSQLVADPAWQINVDGQPVVPGTETIIFSAVVTNAGNVASQPETLELTLTDGEELLIIDEAEIPVLQPNGQTTITFEELAVESETLYEVTVALVVTGVDSDLTDNELRIQFTVNPL